MIIEKNIKFTHLISTKLVILFHMIKAFISCINHLFSSSQHKRYAAYPGDGSGYFSLKTKEC